MSLVTATFEYSDRMVCDSCGTNDQVHYNLVLFHGKNYFMADPDIAVWCENCGGEANMIDPECYEGGES